MGRKMSGLRAAAVAAGRWSRQTFTPSPRAWAAAAAAMVGLWVALFVTLAAGLVVPRFSFEKAAGFLAVFAMLALVSGLLLVLFWLAGRAPARFLAALCLALTPFALVLAIVWGPTGVAIGVPFGLTALVLAAGAGASLLRPGARRSATLVFFLVGVGLVGVAAWSLLAPVADPNPSLANFHLADRTVGLPDPSRPGPYEVTTFTYGGGHDLHRPEYAAGARLVTHSVDGSKLDTRWTGPGGWLRTRYWGFDARALPIQGRVWAPVGRGPFPLVLIVHGNAWMEDPSDTGYAYLGQLLASQGFIAVSVDENFLNGSLADYVNPLQPRFGQENNARAWLLLEHLVQWRAWNQDPSAPMFGKVDMARIALIGHSRGGEAVATAAAFNNLDRYPDDATQAFNFHFNLRAIAAIAPADRQYQPRGQPTPLRDINYFVIQGSMDGDAWTFFGASQFERATFTPGNPAFKASLYVKDADHEQFDTVWGRDDLGLPTFEFLLDERPLLAAETQRRIAQVYIAAFLQATLNGQDGYRALFQDPRAGRRWLPDDYLAANYADGSTRWLATYEEDLDPATGTWPGSTIDGRNLTVWKEALGQRKAGSLCKVIALLAWDERARRATASYRIDLGPTPPVVAADDDLVFSASDAGTGSLPGQAGSPADQPLDWSVVVSDAAGRSARLPLSHDQLLYPQINGATRRIAAMNSIPPSEIVFRRYRFPLVDFVRQNPALDLAHLRSVGFVFDRSPRGAIALSGVGLASNAAQAWGANHPPPPPQR